VDAEKRSVPGFFERIHIRTGVKGPTSGIIELDSDPTSVNYGQKVVGLYIDGDANSPSARHRGNDVLDLTGERLTGEKVWRYTTQDGRGFFTLDFAGNDVQIIVPNGQVEGPEAISFSPNTIIDPEVDLISPTIKATDADDGVAIRNTQYLVEKSVVGFDAQGQKVNLGFRLERISESRWIFEVESERAPGELVAYGLLQFDENGEIDLERSLIFQSPADPDTFDEDGGEEGMPGSSIGFKGIYLDGLRISLDLQDLTQRGGVSEIATSQDGWEEGRLNSLSDVYVTDSGDIIGKYDNGIDQLLGKIQTASFLNKEGLKQVGDGMFRKTVNSCDPRIGDPGSEGRGSLEAFHLELSNVDLIEEFTNMIVAERSFQANVRAITTTDRIIMEVMRLRA
jgi:flagellar hook-basal body protein